MKLLAIDTGTSALSIAVCRPDGASQRIWSHSGEGGAQASAALIPAVLELLQQAELGLAELDAIAFGAGPGSFTGLRTACAVAQGLGFGAGVPLLPVDSLLAVAEQARFSLGGGAPLDVYAVLDARMDEVYAARYAWDGAKWSMPASWSVSKPEVLTALANELPLSAPAAPAPRRIAAGNAFAEYGERLLPGWPQVPALPTATAMLRLAPALLAAGQAVAAEYAMPRYIRDKVAQTTAERAAQKAAAAASG
ncbi:MAG: tRNA (adenosine(37)-N6)-threonylcarbamoyltransferase complex dimerization subunit type 1 TsaB [Burkholderiaceae bacterium]|nr:tRNA (adenosine(37)-N6)-threonylcarbamoyltransferase complex dimerization subunit type 1 TsaB [Burkholderiaceae bacterium]